MTKNFIESFSERSILGKVIDDLRNHEKKHKGNPAKEVQFNPIGFENLERCNFFSQNIHSLKQLNEKGFFTLLGVKCVVNEENEEDYKLIANPKNSRLIGEVSCML